MQRVGPRVNSTPVMTFFLILKCNDLSQLVGVARLEIIVSDNLNSTCLKTTIPTNESSFFCDDYRNPNKNFKTCWSFGKKDIRYWETICSACRITTILPRQQIRLHTHSLSRQILLYTYVGSGRGGGGDGVLFLSSKTDKKFIFFRLLKRRGNTTPSLCSLALGPLLFLKKRGKRRECFPLYICVYVYKRTPKETSCSIAVVKFFGHREK